MPLQYLAGQRLTADALQRAVPTRVLQATDQTVTNSVTPVNSNIVITVDDLIKINMEIVYGTAASAGGFRWDWLATAGVTLRSRVIGSPGAAATSGPTAVSNMLWRNWTQFDTDIFINQMGTSTTNRVSESLVVDGAGTVTLRFAQETAAVPLTTLQADTYALVTRLAA